MKHIGYSAGAGRGSASQSAAAQAAALWCRDRAGERPLHIRVTLPRAVLDLLGNDDVSARAAAAAAAAAAAPRSRARAWTRGAVAPPGNVRRGRMARWRRRWWRRARRGDARRGGATAWQHRCRCGRERRIPRRRALLCHRLLAFVRAARSECLAGRAPQPVPRLRAGGRRRAAEGGGPPAAAGEPARVVSGGRARARALSARTRPCPAASNHSVRPPPRTC